MYVKKLKLPFTIALDGLQALEIFKTAATPYKTIFMGMYSPPNLPWSLNALHSGAIFQYFPV